MDERIMEEINQIVNVIVKENNVLEIYLFGSYAYGTPNKDSDFDIYAILPDDSEKPLAVMQNINQAIFDVMKRPVDLLAARSSTFYERANHQTLEKEVLDKGIKVYGNKQLYKAMA